MIEDGRVAEVYLERPERRSIAGNIYLGVVDNVLPGMEAAFVEIGLEKNGFLYVDEIVVPELEGKRHGKKIQDLISRGEQMLVQAVKDPMKTKGARLTTEISLPGRFLVYVPNGEGLGVSRRLEDAERSAPQGHLKALDAKEGGVIVRTAAEGASAEDVERDLVFLQRLWKTIQARAKSATAPALVYQEAELPLRIVRDLFAGDFVAAHVDDERTHKRIVGYLKKTSPHMIERVHRYKEKEPLFERSGVEKEIASTLERRVDLPSGGYLIFDYAEAFTVIDVNTGRFVGSRSKNSSQRLEDTITKNNLEAVKEVVRQLRLRDIGGIIVIDFIDMANPKNRASVEEALRAGARARPHEDLRRRDLPARARRDDAAERHRRPARDPDPQVPDLRRRRDRRLRPDRGHAGRAQAARARGARAPASRPTGSRCIRACSRSSPGRAAPGWPRSRRRRGVASSSFRPRGTSTRITSRSLAEGKLADLQPERRSRRARARGEARRGGSPRRHGRCRQGRRRRGDRRGRRQARRQEGDGHVGRVLEGQAFATLVESAEHGAGPITFESEAEKPTRALRSRRKAATTTVDGRRARRGRRRARRRRRRRDGRSRRRGRRRAATRWTSGRRRRTGRGGRRGPRRRRRRGADRAAAVGAR